MLPSNNFIDKKYNDWIVSGYSYVDLINARILVFFKKISFFDTFLKVKCIYYCSQLNKATK